MSKTPIQWTEHSINPFRARNLKTGRVGHFCVKCSDGCKHCYSSKEQARFGTFPFLVENRNKVELFLDESKLQEVLRRKKPTTWFWMNMSDMFWEGYPDEWIDRCFATMALTPWHTHQVLTKRAERMKEYFGAGTFKRYDEVRKWMALISNMILPEVDWPLRNVHLGVSVENQETADRRIPELLLTPAAVRFVSYEPVLEAVDFDPYLSTEGAPGVCRDIDGNWWHHAGSCPLCHNALDWLIIGGESGPNARPFKVQGARDTIRECQQAGVPVFMKQFGARPIGEDETDLLWITKLDAKGGNWECWPEWAKVREMPK